MGLIRYSFRTAPMARRPVDQLPSDIQASVVSEVEDAGSSPRHGPRRHQHKDRFKWMETWPCSLRNSNGEGSESSAFPSRWPSWIGEDSGQKALQIQGQSLLLGKLLLRRAWQRRRSRPGTGRVYIWMSLSPPVLVFRMEKESFQVTMV